MARLARVVVTGCPYHVTHRGNRKGDIFFTVQDRRRYLRLLKENAGRYRLDVWAYCLMRNHVHLIVVPALENSLARAVGNAHRRYSRSVNHRQGWTGHLWANRFYSTALDERHLWAAVRYVELNPVRAGLVADPLRYRWSSASAHGRGAKDELLAADRPFPGPIESWRDWLAQGLAPEDERRIRANTSSGRPTGSDEFVRGIEKRLSRPLRRGRAGRPRGSGAGSRGKSGNAYPVPN